ncbi:MAG: hypothetical protein AB1767_10750 [Bacillota bacterium]
MTKREKHLILLLMILALFYCGWTFLFYPLYANYTALRQVEATLIREQDGMLETLRRREEIAASWTCWQSRQERLHISLPSPDQLPAVLKRLEALLPLFPVAVESLQIGEIENQAPLTARRAKLRLSGEARQILLLLERLERFEHLLLIDDLSWSRREDDTVTLELSLRLLFYDR